MVAVNDDVTGHTTTAEGGGGKGRIDKGVDYREGQNGGQGRIVDRAEGREGPGRAWWKEKQNVRKSRIEGMMEGQIK